MESVCRSARLMYRRGRASRQRSFDARDGFLRGKDSQIGLAVGGGGVPLLAPLELDEEARCEQRSEKGLSLTRLLLPTEHYDHSSVATEARGVDLATRA
eukprot:scaffold4760_cov376-Prasinococcus_capsulatus_cf.AAC.2